MLSISEIEEITRYLDASTVMPSRADLIWVFGTKLAEPAHLAADLFATGIAPWLVLTGGNNRRTGINEAEVHLEILLQRGVPQEAIILENRSTNTLENVLFALPLLTARLPSAELKTVILVAKWHHSRRAMMTLRRHLPEGITYYAATYEPNGVSRTGWHLTEEGLHVVCKERDVIPRYLQAGDIAEVWGGAEGYH